MDSIVPPCCGFWSPHSFSASRRLVARLSEGSRRQAISQGMFLGALPLMGAATIVALAVGPGCWLACSPRWPSWC